MLSLLKENADTEYGKLYDLKAINSVSDYKRRVPFTEFKDYEDVVSRMTHGEKNILTAYPIAFYAHTSGTLGAAKFIPVSEKAEEIQHMYRPFPSEVYAEFLGGKPMNRPDHPKVLYLITARGSSAPDGTLITNFSGRLAFEQKEAVMNTAVKPELIFCTEQMDIMYLFAFYALKERELFHIGAPFMSAISDFFCYIRNHWEKLCRDIGEGILRPDVRTSD
ncbi:MAG: GH3 auxin-responsive promoter family protein, partial [Lachnospiraceae bacterium]|nr:GH3 auxin-responsive promoter family protein [Lachnospiraceae bacterium]